MMARTIDSRIGIGLGWLAVLAVAMCARPAHSLPIGPSQAVCELSAKAQDADVFWTNIDRELRLSPRQQIEVRAFCLGYLRAKLVALQDRQQRRRIASRP